MDDRGIVIRVPEGARELYLLQSVQTSSGVPTLRMGQIVGPETLVFNLNQTPGNYPKEDNLNTLKRILQIFDRNR
jgi:hypothetical protein